MVDIFTDFQTKKMYLGTIKYNIKTFCNLYTKASTLYFSSIPKLIPKLFLFYFFFLQVKWCNAKVSHTFDFKPHLTIYAGIFRIQRYVLNI